MCKVAETGVIPLSKSRLLYQFSQLTVANLRLTDCYIRFCFHSKIIALLILLQTEFSLYLTCWTKLVKP